MKGRMSPKSFWRDDEETNSCPCGEQTGASTPAASQLSDEYIPARPYEKRQPEGDTHILLHFVPTYSRRESNFIGHYLIKL
jgi:hypothetical protein